MSVFAEFLKTRALVMFTVLTTGCLAGYLFFIQAADSQKVNEPSFSTICDNHEFIKASDRRRWSIFLSRIRKSKETISNASIEEISYYDVSELDKYRTVHSNVYAPPLYFRPKDGQPFVFNQLIYVAERTFYGPLTDGLNVEECPNPFINQYFDILDKARRNS